MTCGGLAEWRIGGVADWRGVAEWRSGGVAEWRGGGGVARSGGVAVAAQPICSDSFARLRLSRLFIRKKPQSRGSPWPSGPASPLAPSRRVTVAGALPARSQIHRTLYPKFGEPLNNFKMLKKSLKIIPKKVAKKVADVHDVHG